MNRFNRDANFATIIFLLLLLFMLLTSLGCAPFLGSEYAISRIRLMPKDGINGQNGNNGLDGKDGQDGQNGLNGQDGQDGQNGLNGLNGQDGQDGQDGTNTVIETPSEVVPIALCPGTTTYPNKFVEQALCINNQLYGVYSQNNGFLVLLPPGQYVSNGINSTCSFEVLPNCIVYY